MTCFFFQAEDGIRDHCVTGVQTCALPISSRTPCRPPKRSTCSACSTRIVRSEERRVGKSVDLGGRRIIKKKKRTQANYPAVSAKQGMVTDPSGSTVPSIALNVILPRCGYV